MRANSLDKPLLAPSLIGREPDPHRHRLLLADLEPRSGVGEHGLSGTKRPAQERLRPQAFSHNRDDAEDHQCVLARVELGGGGSVALAESEARVWAEALVSLSRLFEASPHWVLAAGQVLTLDGELATWPFFSVKRDRSFYLFTDGVDSVVYEDDGGVRLRRLTGDVPPELEGFDIEVVEAPSPEMTDEEAADRLDSSQEPFVFYKGSATGRDAVLYRRYDGHHGVIEPRGRKPPHPHSMEARHTRCSACAHGHARPGQLREHRDSKQ